MRKRLFLTLVCLLAMVGFANAEVTFHNTNEATVAWDAVTTDVDGDPVTGITYRLYLVNADTDPNKTNPVIVRDNITETTAVITLGTKGRFFVGASARMDDLESVINWADEPENQDNTSLWAIRFAVPPHAPKNMVK